MTDTERARVRGAIQSYMVNHPAQAQSPFWNAFFMRPALAGLAGLLILLGSGAGISFASQESLPSDALYPIKIFREELVGLTKTTPKEKAEYGIARVETRLAEATVLAKTNKLEPELKQKIADTIAKHVIEVEENTRVIEKVSPEIALETTTKLETSLETNVKALEVLTAPEEKSEDPILAIVETKAEDAHTTKIETEVLVQENPSEDIRIKAEGKLAAVKIELAHLDIVSIEPTLAGAPEPVTTDEKPADEPVGSEEMPSDELPVDEGKDESTSISLVSVIASGDEDARMSKQSSISIDETSEVVDVTAVMTTMTVSAPEPVVAEPTRDLFLAELDRLYAEAEAAFALGNYGDALVILQSIEQKIESQKTISTLEQTYEVEIPEQLIEVPVSVSTTSESPEAEKPTEDTSKAEEIKTQAASVIEAVSEIKMEKPEKNPSSVDTKAEVKSILSR